MRFQTQLVPARLIKRYKRFLADCRLETGEEITAHCANPGSMLRLAEPGQKILLEPNDDPKKKLKFGWRLVDHENGHFTGVDTGLPNKVVKSALENREIMGFDGYEAVRAEVRYGDNSRVDFLLTGGGQPDAYVEVKSVTLSRSHGLAEFPDSVTARGTKHLMELGKMAANGQRAVMLYLVQRTDCDRFGIAEDIDPDYAAAYRAALEIGVEVVVLVADISPAAITISRNLPTAT